LQQAQKWNPARMDDQKKGANEGESQINKSTMNNNQQKMAKTVWNSTEFWASALAGRSKAEELNTQGKEIKNESEAEKSFNEYFNEVD
jgi:hypothetical protein